MTKILFVLTFDLIHSKSKGMEASADSFTIYHTRNVTLEKYIRTAYDYSQILLSLAHVIPALCPVLYALIGLPKPSYWFTPIGIEEAWVLAYAMSIDIVCIHHANKAKFDYCRLLFTRTTAFGFEVAVIFNLVFGLLYILIIVAFATIYVNVYSNIKSCVDEFSLIVTWSNVSIRRKWSIKRNLKQFIEMHLHCYR